jgi:hypothetical protein
VEINVIQQELDELTLFSLASQPYRTISGLLFELPHEAVDHRVRLLARSGSSCCHINSRKADSGAL